MRGATPIGGELMKLKNIVVIGCLMNYTKFHSDRTIGFSSTLYLLCQHVDTSKHKHSAVIFKLNIISRLPQNNTRRLQVCFSGGATRVACIMGRLCILPTHRRQLFDYTHGASHGATSSRGVLSRVYRPCPCVAASALHPSGRA